MFSLSDASQIRVEDTSPQLHECESIMQFATTLDEIVEKHFLVMGYIKQYCLQTDDINNEMD